jgi:S-adenosyl-L-methionine hydrolase (adenosine-forming)
MSLKTLKYQGRTMKKTLCYFLLLFSIIFIAVFHPGCNNSKNINLPIVLFTDFGSEDYRVPQLKGMIYNLNIDAEVIDGTHDVPAFDIATGAYILNMAAREFPSDVVFCAIISPYEQEETKYLVLTTGKNQIFVIPDNGLLSYIVQESEIKSIYRVGNEDLFDQPIAELSAERIQSKIAVLMSTGYAAEDVGPIVENYTTLDVQESAISGNTLLGTIVYIDHYGNALTNISGETADEFGLQPGSMINLDANGQIFNIPYGTIYSDVAVGENIVFVNNNLGIVQISINLGNFAGTYGINAGTKIEIKK